MNLKHTTFLLLPLLLAGLPAAAAEYQRTGLKPDVRIAVENVAGLIEVQGWNRTELFMTSELGENVKGVITDTTEDGGVRIRLDIPKGVRDIGESLLRLRVPEGARLDLNSVSADVQVQNVSGELNAQTVSGDLALSVDSARIEARTVSGDLSLSAPRLREARVNSISGDVHIASAGERLRVETVSGDVRVQAGAVTELTLKSVSGDFHVSLKPGVAPRVSAETMSGEIILDVPSAPDAQLSMRSFSGELSSDFGPRLEEDARSYAARLGAGKGRLELNSFSGDIVLRKR